MLLCAVLRLESSWNQVRNVQQVLSEPFDEWKVCADALNDLAFAVESLGLDDSKKEAVHQLMPIAVSYCLLADLHWREHTS